MNVVLMNGRRGREVIFDGSWRSVLFDRNGSGRLSNERDLIFSFFIFFFVVLPVRDLLLLIFLRNVRTGGSHFSRIPILPTLLLFALAVFFSLLLKILVLINRFPFTLPIET